LTADAEDATAADDDGLDFSGVPVDGQVAHRPQVFALTVFDVLADDLVRFNGPESLLLLLLTAESTCGLLEILLHSPPRALKKTGIASLLLLAIVGLLRRLPEGGQADCQSSRHGDGCYASAFHSFNPFFWCFGSALDRAGLERIWIHT
jgi:hypothetical protein